MEHRLRAFVVYLIICSTTGRVHSSENHKRFLLDDGTDMNEKVFQMEHEIQSLKSTMQELVEVAKRTGTCSCQGNFNLFRFFYVLTSGVNMLKATNRNYSAILATLQITSYALVASSADSVPSSNLIRITIAPIGTTFGNLQ